MIVITLASQVKKFKCVLNLYLNHKNPVMVNYFGNFYMLPRRFNKNSIEVKIFFNLIDTTEVVIKVNFYNQFIKIYIFLI